jgi:hypothetical protein
MVTSQFAMYNVKWVKNRVNRVLVCFSAQVATPQILSSLLGRYRKNSGKQREAGMLL